VVRHGGRGGEGRVSTGGDGVPAAPQTGGVGVQSDGDRALASPYRGRQSVPEAGNRPVVEDLGPQATDFFSAAPAENFGSFFAAMSICSPVAGLMPLRALRSATEN
jgi:hypothetical protein